MAVCRLRASVFCLVEIEMRPMQAMIRNAASICSRSAAVVMLGLLCGSLQVANVATASPIAQCRAITDDGARLRCFDQIDRAEPSPASPAPAAIPAIPAAPAAPAASAPAAPSAAPSVAAPPVAPAAAATVAPPAAADFGARALLRAATVEPRELSARLIGKLDGVFRGLNLSLDNGQTWVVIDDRDFEYVGSNAKVTLDRNLIGTYWMKIVDGGPRFKVRRVK